MLWFRATGNIFFLEMFVTFARAMFSTILTNQTNELSPIWCLSHEDADFRINRRQPKSLQILLEHFREHISSIYVYTCLHTSPEGSQAPREEEPIGPSMKTCQIFSITSIYYLENPLESSRRSSAECQS